MEDLRIFGLGNPLDYAVTVKTGEPIYIVRPNQKKTRKLKRQKLKK